MSPEGLVLGVMGLGLVAYALGAGADFGGGVWDLLARGPRAERQRALVEHSIAPIWEANHVWLIFIVVLTFTVFPRAFAVIATAFHVPLLLALLGIVLRGSAFTFRAYGLEPAHRRRWWQRTFAWSSLIAPLFLGATLGGISSGRVQTSGAQVVSGFFAAWTTSFAWMVGVFTLTLFALLAAVYLTLDASREGDEELVEDFRRRTIAMELVAGAAAMATLWRASVDAPQLFENLLHEPWSLPVQVATAAAALSVVVAARARRYALARVCVIVQVTFVVVGWGLAMDGHLVLPDVRYDEAGALPQITRPLMWVLAIGGLLVVPSLYALFRVFKSPQPRSRQ